MTNLRVAIIHDWLVTMRGGERVLEVFLEMFPKAEIFTIVFDPQRITSKIKSVKINTSFIQHFPFAKKFYRHYLLFHPSAVEAFDLRGFDLVISLSHCAAKGVIVPPGIPHLCYMFTPMRYAYDMFYEYFNFAEMGIIKKTFFAFIFNYLRTWDFVSAQRIDKIITISEFVRKRISRYYSRDCKVIYPPVDIQRFHPENEPAKDDYYLIVSAMVPYKRIEIAVDLFNRTGKKLVIIGSGPEKKRLKKRAKDNIIFPGFLKDRNVTEYYRKAKAFIFPGIEDFGITMVEALAAGTPVIAFKGGGAEEIIKDGKNGLFFDKPTPESLELKLNEFNPHKFNATEIINSSECFSIDRFKSEILKEIKELMGQYEK